MRRLVVALIAAALVLGLAGCGGEPETPAPKTPAAAPVLAPAPAPTVPPAGGVSTGLSDNEPAVFSPFPTSPEMPAEVLENIEAKEPTLLYFYDSSQNTSKDSRKIINGVLDKNRGLVELIAYDIGKYMTGDASQPVAIDPKFEKDSNARAAVELARSLGVSYTPFIVLTDGQGYIVWKFKGLVDRDFLEREVLRASN